MPQSLILEFQPLKKLAIKRISPESLHGLLFHLIGTVQPELAETLHHNRLHPFSLSPPFPSGKQAPGLYRFRCAVLEPGIPEALNQYFLEHLNHLELQLGSHSIRVTRLLSSPTEAEIWSQQRSYADLLSQASKTQTRFSFKFCSPTAFKTGNTLLPLPLPERVFGSYLQRWNQFSPMPFELEPLQNLFRHQLALAQHRIESSRWHHFLGFTGRASFVLTGTAATEQIQALNTLADFAYYCGTGYKTGMGCGWTRRLPEND